MRILFCARRDTAHPRAGGSEVLVDRLASGLAARGHDVALLAGAPTGPHEYAARANGSELAQFLRAPVVFHRHFADRDLVVDVANGMAFCPTLWCRRPAICLVNHLHTEQWDDWFSPPAAALGRFLEQRAMPWAHRRSLFVAVSPSTARALVEIGVKQDRIAVVPNGVDLPVEAGEEDPEPLFLALGRLVPHKRYEALVRLWEQVRPTTGGRLVIAGEGPADRDLRAAAGAGVELLGRVDEPTKANLLDRAWLLLHPARVEGWALVIMEAAARGTPALAFDAPGVRDSIVQGATGELATSEADFVQRWIRLATDPTHRHRLGAAARTRAATYPWSRTIEAFEAVADEAVGRHGRLAGEDLRTRIPAYEGWRPAPTDTAMARLGGAMSNDDRDPEGRRELFRLFLAEKHDPGPFYERLAARSVAELGHPVRGSRLLDLGCGPGHYTRALREAGAEVVAVDRDRVNLGDDPTELVPAALADAGRLPARSGSFDGVFCSNLLEHTPDAGPVLDEIERVLVPGGWAWISWTNWYSPWGGHEIAPLHLLGPRVGLATWRRLFGEPRKNVPFDALWPTHVGRTLRLVNERPGLRLVSATPRYYPSQAWIVRVPGLREVATWNCLLQLERVSGP